MAIYFSTNVSSNTNLKQLSLKMNLVTSEIKDMSNNGLQNNMGSARIHIWKMTLKVICEFPVLGCGVDSLKYGLQKAASQENTEYILKYGQYVDKAHNEYLQIAATMGIPAVIVYLIFIAIIVLINLKRIKKKKIAMLFFTVIIGYLAQAFFNISTISIAPIFWFILGIASKNNSMKKHIIELK